MCGEGPYCPYCQQAHREWRENPATFDIQEHGLHCKPGVADQREAENPESFDIQKPGLCCKPPVAAQCEARVSLEAHPVCKCAGTTGRRCNRCMAKLGADDSVKEEVLEQGAKGSTR